MPLGTRQALGRPITLEQAVYVPGNDRQGMWFSPMLETVFGPEPKGDRGAAPGQPVGISLRGDLELIVFAAGELHRSYSQLPVRWAVDLASSPRIRGLFGARRPAVPPDGRTPNGERPIPNEVVGQLDGPAG
jgi:hypothetical protein